MGWAGVCVQEYVQNCVEVVGLGTRAVAVCGNRGVIVC